MYEVEAKLLKEAKKKNNYEEYDEFNAEEQLQQLIDFTADKVVGRAEAQAESRAHAEAESAKGTKRKRQTPKKVLNQCSKIIDNDCERYKYPKKSLSVQKSNKVIYSELFSIFQNLCCKIIRHNCE